MSQRVGIAWAAAAVIGFGGFLAASAPGVVAAAVASPATDISAQATRKEQRQERAQERRQEQREERRQERAQERRQEQREERRQERIVINPRGGPRLDVRIRGGGPIRLGGRDVVVIRGPHSVMWRGRRRNLVPLAAIAALTVGGVAYAANAYVPVEQPVCTGYTEGGCFFHWAEVPTPEGDLVPQCVAYCPR